MGFPGATSGKEPTCQYRTHETRVQSLGWKDLLEEGMATHSSILAWRIPWTEDPGGLQFMGSQRFRYYWATNTYKCSIRVCFWRTETKEIGRISGEHSLNQEGGEAFTILKCYPSSITVRSRDSGDKLPGSKFWFCLLLTMILGVYLNFFKCLSFFI